MVSGPGGSALTVGNRNKRLRGTWKWYCLVVEAVMKGRGATLGCGTSGQLWYHVVVDHRATTMCTGYWMVDGLTCWRKVGRKRSCQLGHEGRITSHVRGERSESSCGMSTTSSLRRHTSWPRTSRAKDTSVRPSSSP